MFPLFWDFKSFKTCSIFIDFHFVSIIIGLNIIFMMMMMMIMMMMVIISIIFIISSCAGNQKSSDYCEHSFEVWISTIDDDHDDEDNGDDDDDEDEGGDDDDDDDNNNDYYVMMMMMMIMMMMVIITVIFIISSCAGNQKWAFFQGLSINNYVNWQRRMQPELIRTSRCLYGVNTELIRTSRCLYGGIFIRVLRDEKLSKLNFFTGYAGTPRITPDASAEFTRQRRR